MSFSPFLFALACILSLAGCQKDIKVTGVSGAQTVDYFSKNPEVAKTVAYKCLDFEKKDYSRLSSAAQKEWQDSTDGINCKNAREAATWIVMGERQQKMREASRKYGVDATSK